MPSNSFQSTVKMTHIGTATAILSISGVNFLTDPVFGPAGVFPQSSTVELVQTEDPGVKMDALPVIDCVLLSHEDHVDNLDRLGRQLLDGRNVLTTVDGAKNLAPRPAVKGLKPWETVELVLQGKAFKITGTPCEHFETGECTGFVIETEEFGRHEDGRPNSIYVSGDTIYTPELADIKKKWHVVVSVLNLGAAKIPFESRGGAITMITFDGESGARLHKDLGAEILVPMHYNEWTHFTEFGDDLRKAFEKAGISEQVTWMEKGKEITVL